MTGTDELAGWLRATLDRVEQQAMDAGGGSWRADGSSIVGGSWRSSSEHAIVTETWPRESAHIAFWDPARVLRLVEATRRILDVCEADLRQRGEGALRGEVDRPTWDVLTAAAMWLGDQPGYRAEWAPSA